MRLQIRTPGDLQSVELVAYDRVPPGPGQIEVSVIGVEPELRRRAGGLRAVPELRGSVAASSARTSPVWSPRWVPASPNTRSVTGSQGSPPPVRGARSSRAMPASRSRSRRECRRSGRPPCQAHTPPPGTACTTWPGSKQGDKVLIHSATGGVGQAAVAIAKAAGAEIFATAGSPERRELLRTMGNRARLRFAQRRLRRRDPQGHRRLRRRRRAQLPARCGPAGGSGTAELRRSVRGDRQARHLRRHQDGTVPVPPQPLVLRRRPRRC